MAKFTCKCGRPCNDEGGCFIHKKRKPLRKSGASLSKKKLDKETSDKMWELFREIWNERPHRSEVSGEWIKGEPLTTYFDHLLEKATYDHLKYDKRNIIIVTANEHHLKGMGMALEKHLELIAKAKEELLGI